MDEDVKKYDELDKYDELVNAMLPILEEINQLKKLVDEKTFNDIVKKIEF